MEDIKELINRLEDYADWAEANIWEVPIMLPDDLNVVINILKDNFNLNDRL